MSLTTLTKSSIFLGIASLLVWESAFAQRGLRSRGKSKSEISAYKGNGAKNLPSYRRASEKAYDKVNGVGNNGAPAYYQAEGSIDHAPGVRGDLGPADTLTAEQQLQLQNSVGETDPMLDTTEAILSIAEEDPAVTTKQKVSFSKTSLDALRNWNLAAKQKYSDFIELVYNTSLTQQVINMSLAVTTAAKSMGIKGEKKECSILGAGI